MDVFRFPPVRLVAFENGLDGPVAVSRGVSGTPYGSQIARNRRQVAARVPAISQDAAGYIETMKHMMAGKLPLVQMDLLPMHWLRANGNRGPLGQVALSWTAGGVALGWTAGTADLTWTMGSVVDAVAGSDSWPYLDCTGIAAGLRIAVGEAVTSGGVRAYVTRPVTSDGGTVRLYLSRALASGEITIGVRETMVLRMTSWPRAMQIPGLYFYDFDLVEVFEAEFSGGFTLLDPWQETAQ